MINEKPKSNATTQSTRVVVALPLFLSFLLMACYPPMKMPLRVKPVAGTGEDLRTEPDTSVIHPGVTTRVEILHQFAAFDTGWRGERLFLGRWVYSGMVATGGRWWAGKILAVEFDKKGVVTRYRVLSDNDFLRDKDSSLLTPAKEDEGDQQVDWVKLNGYRIEAGEIERLGRSRDATVYSPAIKTASDIGVVIHLKRKIYNDADVKKKHAVTRITVECSVPTAVLLMRLASRPTRAE